MWQVDNDRYHLWHLEHELAPNRLDKLLNSITESDRSESWIFASCCVTLVARSIRRLGSRLMKLPAGAAIGRAALE